MLIKFINLKNIFEQINKLKKKCITQYDKNQFFFFHEKIKEIL